MKQCQRCKQWKDESEFNKHSAKKDGLQSWCRECVSKHCKEWYVSMPNEKMVEISKTRKLWRESNPKRRRFLLVRSSLKYAGCSIDDDVLSEFLSRQPEKCEICGTPSNGKQLCVDHDHRSHELRGYLCGKCNRWFIGQFGDVKLLSNAVRYLTVDWTRRLVKSGAQSKHKLSKYRAALKSSGNFTDNDDTLAEFILRRPSTCEICGHPSNGRALHMDHDHETGRLRGYLCEQCNRVLIGQYGDLNLLNRAIWYLSTPWQQRLKDPAHP